MRTFSPRLPPEWELAPGCVVPIPLEEDLTWLEDLYLASWNGWSIWLDGGKGITTWECTLVHHGEEVPEPAHNVMRDLVDTTEELQGWLDRAVVVAVQASESYEVRLAAWNRTRAKVKP